MNEEFKKWAIGYSGFDGGNPNGKIWLCGIEWGGESPKNIDEIKKLFSEKVDDIDEIKGYPDYKKNLEFNYNKRFINIIGALKDSEFPINKNEVAENIKDLNEKEKFFTENSNYFKLNLSPFNFPNTKDNKWNEDYTEATGFASKSEYVAWVLNSERCEVFQDMISDHSPKLIITFGNSKKKNYTKNFKKFFGFENQKLEVKEYKKIND